MTDEEIERDRQQLLTEQDEQRADWDPNWRERVQGDAFSRHEALHLASVFGDMVEDHLAKHPFVLLDPKLYALAARACWHLAELYQAVGGHPLSGEQPSNSHRSAMLAKQAAGD